MASLKNIEKEAFQLSKQERAILARNLIQSIDEEECEEENCEELWIEEADRRYQELKQGKVKGIPAQEVLEI
jgi:putative addiction module component (TIGR02574 family)